MTTGYIVPLTDFGFLRLFKNESNKVLTQEVLSELIDKEDTIRDLTYLKPEQLGLSNVINSEVQELYCETAHGQEFLVELRKARHNWFKDRETFYMESPLYEWIQGDQTDFQVDAVYVVGILNFVFKEDENSPDVLHRHVQHQRARGSGQLCTRMIYVYVELPKFMKTEDELETHLDKWLYIIKNLALLSNRPECFREPVFDRLFEVAEIGNLDSLECRAYEESLKHHRDLKNVIDTAWEEGMALGLKESRRGRPNTLEEAAKRMKAAGEPVSKIGTYTGLTPEEICRLR